MPAKKAPASQPIFHFRLMGINTEQYATFLEAFDSKLPIDSTPSLRYKSDKAQHRVGVFAKVEHSQKENLFMVLEVGCHFHFAEESWARLIQKDESLKIAKDLAAHLGFLTMSTLRGVLYEKSVSLACGQLVLPLLNLAEAIQEDVLL